MFNTSKNDDYIFCGLPVFNKSKQPVAAQSPPVQEKASPTWPTTLLAVIRYSVSP